MFEWLRRKLGGDNINSSWEYRGYRMVMLPAPLHQDHTEIGILYRVPHESVGKMIATLKVEKGQDCSTVFTQYIDSIIQE